MCDTCYNTRGVVAEVAREVLDPATPEQVGRVLGMWFEDAALCHVAPQRCAETLRAFFLADLGDDLQITHSVAAQRVLNVRLCGGALVVPVHALSEGALRALQCVSKVAPQVWGTRHLTRTTGLLTWSRVHPCPRGCGTPILPPMSRRAVTVRNVVALSLFRAGSDWARVADRWRVAALHSGQPLAREAVASGVAAAINSEDFFRCCGVVTYKWHIRASRLFPR